MVIQLVSLAFAFLLASKTDATAESYFVSFAADVGLPYLAI